MSQVAKGQYRSRVEWPQIAHRVQRLWDPLSRYRTVYTRHRVLGNQVPGRRQCCATGHRGTGNATFIETGFGATRYRWRRQCCATGHSWGYWHCNETTAPIVNPWGIGPPIGHPWRSRASGLCPPLVATRYRGAGNALQPDIGELAMHRNCRPDW